jgi:type I restriction enzyme S subunit
MTESDVPDLPARQADTFHDHARFVFEHLPRLTTRPEHIKQLRQTILNLSVRGKLVPQDRHDEPAIKRENAFTLGPDIVSFPIPPTWRWATLKSLGQLKGGGTPSKSRPDYWEGEIPWVSPKDMKRDYIATAQLSISQEAIQQSAVNLIEPGSLLFVVRGMILAHSFPVALSRIPLTINQDMKALEFSEPAFGEYLLRALKGLKSLVLSKVQRSSHGTCRLEGTDYSNLPIPLPPLAEQRRIVARVDELMALCDQLEVQLTTTEADSRRLLEALLHEALNPPLEVTELQWQL